MILLAGWFVLSVVCFAMGTGMMRPKPVEDRVDEDLRKALRIPAPRQSADTDTLVSA